jgi:hypothetical protein
LSASKSTVAQADTSATRQRMSEREIALMPDVVMLGLIKFLRLMVSNCLKR